MTGDGYATTICLWLAGNPPATSFRYVPDPDLVVAKINRKSEPVVSRGRTTEQSACSRPVERERIGTKRIDKPSRTSTSKSIGIGAGADRNRRNAGERITSCFEIPLAGRLARTSGIELRGIGRSHANDKTGGIVIAASPTKGSEPIVTPIVMRSWDEPRTGIENVLMR
jgi:hypothetical protein